jgi:hypothetical protein
MDLSTQYSPWRRGHEAKQRQGRYTLSPPGLSDETQDFPSPDFEVHPINGLDNPFTRKKMGSEI